MNWLDWLVLIGATLFIVLYGVWKNRHQQGMKGYLLADYNLKWWMIGLSIMATQASAITFLSTPGQAYDDGMRFVQFYFGVPVAMVLISIVAIPIYRRLGVFTAYEYLESRFNLPTRLLAALLFLLSRGLAAGMTIFAPSLILSALLGWPVESTCVVIGLLVVVYTVSGGNAAVSQTQQQQMFIILLGMIAAGAMMVWKLPADVSLGDAMRLAGGMGKLDAITLPGTWDQFVRDRYNLFSGLIAGTFLQLSYFGTDQSQVSRYLGGRSMAEIRIGLLFNGVFKVPMQFLILLVGVLMYVFYQFNAPPVFFNEQLRQRTLASADGAQLQAVEAEYQRVHAQKAALYRAWLESGEGGGSALRSAVREADSVQRGLRSQGLDLIARHSPDGKRPDDRDYVFLSFILHHMPAGLLGLVMCMIFAAAMSSSSAEINSLAATTVVDFYQRLARKGSGEIKLVRVSRLLTLLWGFIAIGFSLIAGRFGNLIQAVNIVGSLFYGTILGIFVTAFFLRRVQGRAVFPAAILAELVVVACYVLPQMEATRAAFAWLDIGFLWLNLIGCVAVMAISLLIQALLPARKTD